MKQQRSVIFMVALAILVGVPLAIPGNRPWVVSIAFLIVFASGLSVAAEGGRRRLVAGVAILSPAFAARVLESLGLNVPQIEVLSVAAATVALTYLLWVAMNRFLKARRVTYDTLGAAIAAYLLLGVMWAFAFKLVWVFRTDAFRGLGDDPHDIAEFYYLSFVTMSTLGYGDVVPTFAAARAMTVACAITGQLYLTIMMAIVIGKLIAGHQTEIDSD